MREWVREIDRSVDVLSESVRDLLRSSQPGGGRELLQQAESIKRATEELARFRDCSGRPYFNYDEERMMRDAENRVEAQLIQAELNKTSRAFTFY